MKTLTTTTTMAAMTTTTTATMTTTTATMTTTRSLGLCVLLIASLSCCSLLGCSDLEPTPAGVTAVYGPPDQTVLTPYPSNRYTRSAEGATGLRVALPEGSPDLVMTPEVAITADELEQMDGFSTTGGVIVTFDGPIDTTGIATRPEGHPDNGELRDAPTYMEAGSPLLLLDVDPDSPARGTAIALTPRWWEQVHNAEFVTDEFTLIAAPAEPLRPATRYLFVVTDALRARDGGAIHRSADMQRLIAGAAPEPYAQQLRAGLDVLESSLAVGRERVALATVFTTASVHDGVFAMARLARAASAPMLLDPWTVETSLTGTRIRYRATFDAPEYRSEPPDSRWQLDDDGAPIEQSRAGLEVFMAVSDAESGQRRIPVIFGHGLGGDKDGSWGTAERLAPLNAAVFSIDSPHHGSRGPGGIAAMFPFFGFDADDASFVIGRARDNFRQMASDQLELVKLIRSLDTLDILPPGAPDGVPDLDTSRILYIGHSFGSVQGPLVFALAPEIKQAVWNVGGAGLMMLLRDSNLFSLAVINGLRPPGQSDGAVARFMAVAQAVVDPGDPLNFARFAQRQVPAGVEGWLPRDVLLQEVVGDTIVPNTTSRMLARATGLELMDPIDPILGLPRVAGAQTGNLASGTTGAISQFDRIDGDKIATHGDLIFSPEGKAQYLHFFESGLQNGRATILSPYEGTAVPINKN
jgi:hypothetical protein